MNLKIICIYFMLFNIYLIFGEITLEQQCIDIKTFMRENKIPIPTKDNCCFNNVDYKEPPYIITKCEEENKVTQL